MPKMLSLQPPGHKPVAAAAPESLNISCEVTFRARITRLNGAISEKYPEPVGYGELKR